MRRGVATARASATQPLEIITAPLERRCDLANRVGVWFCSDRGGAFHGSSLRIYSMRERRPVGAQHAAPLPQPRSPMPEASRVSSRPAHSTSTVDLYNRARTRSSMVSCTISQPHSSFKAGRLCGVRISSAGLTRAS